MKYWHKFWMSNHLKLSWQLSQRLCTSVFLALLYIHTVNTWHLTLQTFFGEPFHSPGRTGELLQSSPKLSTNPEGELTENAPQTLHQKTYSIHFPNFNICKQIFEFFGAFWIFWSFLLSNFHDKEFFTKYNRNLLDFF